MSCNERIRTLTQKPEKERIAELLDLADALHSLIEEFKTLEEQLRKQLADR